MSDRRVLTAATLLGIVSACGRGGGNVEALPSIKTRVGVLCSSPEPTFPFLDIACPMPGDGCQGTTVAARVEATGRVSRVWVEGPSEPAFLTCAEGAVRRLTFLPAKQCDGQAVPAEWRQEFVPICDPVLMETPAAERKP